jgi:hypothetical protein
MALRAQRLAKELDVPVVASFHTHFVSYSATRDHETARRLARRHARFRRG